MKAPFYLLSCYLGECHLLLQVVEALLHPGELLQEVLVAESLLVQVLLEVRLPLGGAALLVCTHQDITTRLQGLVVVGGSDPGH